MSQDWIKVAIRIVSFAFVGSLMVYTASRTLHLMQSLLPPAMAALAILSLVAFDGGVVYWVVEFLYASRGATQRGIAFLMGLFDLLGSILGFTGDTLVYAGSQGKVTIAAWVPTTVIIGVCIVVAVNVAMGVLHFMSDPRNRRAIALENANDIIEAKTIAAIQAAAHSFAPQAATHAGQTWLVEEARKRGVNLPDLTNNNSHEETEQTPSQSNGWKTVASSNGRQK